MSFVHPLVVWGTLLGAIPIIIHILSRRRYRVVRWAATDFLLAALSERSRNVRIQDLILLAIRVLVLVLAAAAVARPIVTSSAAGLGLSAADAVIVLDASYSMRTNVGGQTRMAAAKKRAADVLAGLPARARVGLVRMDERATRVTEGLSADRAVVGPAIDGVEAGFGGTDARAAIETALEMLAGSTASQKKAFLVTDAQAAAFERSSDALRTMLADADDSIGFVVLTTPNQSATNAAVTGLSVRSRWVRVGQPVELEATVHDFSDPPQGLVAVELWVEGRKVDRRQVTLTDRLGTATFRHSFTTDGLSGVEARLDPDAIDADNHRHLAVFVPASIDVLAVVAEGAGDVGASAYRYLEAALSMGEGRDGATPSPPFALRPAVTAGRLASELTDEVWIVALADPGPLPADALDALGRFAERGGAVLLAAGPNAPASFGVMRSGKAGAASWLSDLPFSLAAPSGEGNREPLHPAAAGVAEEREGAAGPGVIDVAAQGVREAIASVNVFDALTLEPGAGSAWRTVLSLSDGRPLLVAADGPGSGRGVGVRMVVFASSLDVSWTDLPYRAAMVPLVNDALVWLSWPRLVGGTLRPGEAWEPAGGGGARGRRLAESSIRLPDGEVLGAAGFVETIDGAIHLRFDRTTAPGVYRIVSDTPAGDAGAGQAVAVNVDPAESDPRVWSADQIRSLFPAGRCDVVPAEAASDAAALAGLTGSEIWKPLVILVALLVLGEALLAHRFSLQKRSEATARAAS